MEKNSRILNARQLEQKIKRIAYQIYENNFEEKEIAIVGIDGGGFEFATRLARIIPQISGIACRLAKISLDKHQAVPSQISLDCPLSELENKAVILADDVLNTGRTLAYSLKPFLEVRVKRLQTAVVADRSHKSFPIEADFVGYALSTTVSQHVQVVFGGEEEGVYLF